MVAEPDEVKVHLLTRCTCCDADVSGEATLGCDRRQVFELPPFKVTVREHQVEVKRCPECGALNRAVFPEGVKQPTQYGPRLKGLVQYLLHYQLLPLKRTQELFADLFSHELSQGTLVNASKRCYEELAINEASIRQGIVDAEVICASETSCTASGQRQWLSAGFPSVTRELHAE